MITGESEPASIAWQSIEEFMQLEKSDNALKAVGRQVQRTNETQCKIGSAQYHQ